MAMLPESAVDLAGPRDLETEGLITYTRRAWQAEFDDALGKIADPEVKRALIALRALQYPS